MGFWAILMDRERHAGQLAHRVAHGRFRDTEHTRTVIASGRFDGRALPTVDPWGPGHFARPWLVLAGVLLGLTCAVKWSGIYALAVFGLLTLALGAVSRKIAGVPLWFGGATFRDGIPAFIQLVPVALVAYLAGWTSWFLNPHSWGRNWVAEARKTGEDLPLSWAPDIVNSFIHYHQDMWSFHHSLSETHTYQSQAWEWIFQGRPVNFYWEEKGAPRTCGASKCVQAITSIGNVGVWWLAIDRHGSGRRGRGFDWRVRRRRVSRYGAHPALRCGRPRRAFRARRRVLVGRRVRAGRGRRSVRSGRPARRAAPLR